MDADEQLDQIARTICIEKGYQYIDFVAAGAFKRTYHVKLGHEKDGESVALKIYLPHFSRERTARELSAMRRCAHAGVCQLRDTYLFNTSGKEYTVTIEEFLPDGTLASRLDREGLLNMAEILKIGEHLIESVAYIASLDLVHRDIKPENVILRGQVPVLVDFGLVRDLGATSLTMSWQAQGPGTPLFAPPEQLRNEKGLIDWRSDQFSLGVTLSYCAFGFHPYDMGNSTASDGARIGDAARIVEWATRRIGPSERFVSSTTAAGLNALVKMVSPWPVQRYRKPGDLISAWRTQRS